MSDKNIVNIHRKIISALEEMVQKNDNGTIKISKLANMAKSDVRTVRKHLEIAEIHNIGMFIDKDKTIFCVRRMGHLFDDDQKPILEYIQKRMKDIYGNKSAVEVLDNKKR